jgi:hypothetical protein
MDKSDAAEKFFNGKMICDISAGKDRSGNAHPG